MQCSTLKIKIMNKLLLVFLFFGASSEIVYTQKLIELSLDTFISRDRVWRTYIVLKSNSTIIDSIMELPSGIEIESYYFEDKSNVIFVRKHNFRRVYSKMRYYSDSKYRWRTIDEFGIPCFVPRSFDPRPHVTHHFKIIDSETIIDNRNGQNFILSISNMSLKNKQQRHYQPPRVPKE